MNAYHLDRVSACCHDSIYHPNSWNTHYLDDVLEVCCVRCDKPTHIVLVDEFDNVIWEAPEEER